MIILTNKILVKLLTYKIYILLIKTGLNFLEILNVNLKYNK